MVRLVLIVRRLAGNQGTAVLIKIGEQLASVHIIQGVYAHNLGSLHGEVNFFKLLKVRNRIHAFGAQMLTILFGNELLATDGARHLFGGFTILAIGLPKICAGML